MREFPSLLKRMQHFHAWQLIKMCCPDVLQVKNWTRIITQALKDMEGTPRDNVLGAFVASSSGRAFRNLFPDPVFFLMTDSRYATYNELERAGIVVLDLPSDSRLDIFRGNSINEWLLTADAARWGAVFWKYVMHWQDAHDPTGAVTREWRVDSESGEPPLRKSLVLLEKELNEEGTVPESIYKAFQAIVELLLHNPLVWTCCDAVLSL